MMHDKRRKMEELKRGKRWIEATGPGGREEDT